MKIKVLLVDDEKLERVLIRKGFPWEEKGFEIIGEASCGEDALEFVNYRKPDIVITDISMPRMDGLALAEEIMKVHPLCHIVIVTGYREFDYARRAIKIGVMDFLLKPVSMRDLKEVIGKIEREIEQEKSKREAVEELKKNILANQDIVRESFFQRLIVGRISMEEATRRLLAFDCGGLLEHCICANIHLVKSEDKRVLTEKQDCVLRKIAERNPENMVCFIHYMQNIILLFMEWQMDKVVDYCTKLQETLKDSDVVCTIGVSRKKSGFEGIAKAYEESEKAISAFIFLGRAQVITYQQYDDIVREEPGKNEMDWGKLLFSVENGLEDKMQECVKSYLQIISKYKDLELRRLLAMNFLAKAGDSLAKYKKSMIQLVEEEELYNEIFRVNSMNEMEHFLLKHLRIICEYHQKKRGKKGNRVVEEAMKYIDEHLYDMDLSLKVVAAQIYSNESYLSRIFKREIGISLIEYITQNRIEESMRLLKSTDLKAYEIADKIGFKNSHYFSICFKKISGVTIKEFREK